VAISSRWGFLLAALIGAGVHLIYGLLQDSYIPPAWWQDHLRLRLGVVTWFTLINCAGALLAAIPVAWCLARFARAHKMALSLSIGVPPSLYIMGSGLIDYGLPHYTSAWIVEFLQFLSISLAILVIVTLSPRRATGAML
jgi:hypothetical protein